MTDCPFGSEHALSVLNGISEKLGAIEPSLAVVHTKIEHVSAIAESSLDLARGTVDRMHSIAMDARDAKTDAAAARADCAAMRNELNTYRTWTLRSAIAALGGVLWILWEWGSAHLTIKS